MKHRVLIFIIVFMMILTVMPTAAYAQPAPGSGYNAHDYIAIETFLEQESATTGVKNGTQLNPAYDPADPTTWTGIKWNADAEKRVEGIDITNCSLAGALDLSDFTSLYYVLSGDNAITVINASGCSALDTLSCSNNSLTTLDVSNSSLLRYLSCSDNALTTLDLSTNTAIEEVNCYINSLANLNLGTNTALTSLICNNNSLTALDVSANTALTSLFCYENKLTALDVSSNTALTNMNCNNNSLTALNVSSNTALTYLNCNNNSLTALNVSTNTALTDLDCSDNSLTALDVSNLAGLKFLVYSYNAITSLDLSHNTVLEWLGCASNGLTALDVSKITTLAGLDCSGNALTALDLSQNTALSGLICFGNKLTALDLSNNTALQLIDCRENLLTSIKAVLSGGSVILAVNGNGYVELYNILFVDLGNYTPQPLVAITSSTDPFVNWTQGGAEFSTTTPLTLTAGTNYDLAANFLSLASTVSGGKIYTGGRMTLTPSLEGGTWDWDEEFFTATFNSPATFTALKAGTSTITYTLNGLTKSYEVTVEKSALPSTGQDFTLMWLLIAAAGALAFGGGFMIYRKRRTV